MESRNISNMVLLGFKHDTQHLLSQPPFPVRIMLLNFCRLGVFSPLRRNFLRLDPKADFGIFDFPPETLLEWRDRGLKHLRNLLPTVAVTAQSQNSDAFPAHVAL